MAGSTEKHPQTEIELKWRRWNEQIGAMIAIELGQAAFLLCALFFETGCKFSAIREVMLEEKTMQIEPALKCFKVVEWSRLEEFENLTKSLQGVLGCWPS